MRQDRTSSVWSDYLLAWQKQRCEEALANIFGYHALQIGHEQLHALSTSRIAHRWFADTDINNDNDNDNDANSPADLYCRAESLPFSEESLDLLVLPHTLERCAQPHAALREVARVLVPEGKVLIFGLNPWSLWGVQHAFETRTISYWRLRDWLELLALEVVAADFGCHAPALKSEQWLQRWRWLDRAGERLCPPLGGAYCVLATKKVYGGLNLRKAQAANSGRVKRPFFAAPAPTKNS